VALELALASDELVRAALVHGESDRSCHLLAARRRFQHLSRLLGRTREELDEQVDDDLVLVVVVEAHVGEEFARSVVAEGGVAARVLTNVLWYWPLFALIPPRTELPTTRRSPRGTMRSSLAASSPS
jgi:hypothetical protein